MTSGNPVKLIVLFAVPLLIGNIFQQLYNISDIIIVGRLIGVEALAAAGASAPIYFYDYAGGPRFYGRLVCYYGTEIRRKRRSRASAVRLPTALWRVWF